MPRPEVPPTIRRDEGPGKSFETVESHPSYGMVGLSRVSGGSDNLFGSSVSHQNHIELRIRRAERRRGLNTDWYFGKEELISIMLSPTQFSELITSMNIGDGVPCTFDAINGELIPSCPERHIRQEVQDEFEEDMKRVAADLGEATGQLEALLGPGTIKKSDLRALADNLRRVIQELASNIPFAQQCFDEACDKAVGEAKGEIDAAFTSMVARLGVQKLQEMQQELLGMSEAPQALTIESRPKIPHEAERDQREN